MNKQKQYWNVKTTANNREVDVFIYGIIGSGWWEDESDTTAFSFVPEFKELEKKYDRINIRINSPGGSIHDGLPVFNAILSSKKDVHTYNDGIAYSMGAIILLAGKTVHAAKNSLTLLHSPLTYAAGNAKEMRNTADFLDTYAQALIQSIVGKTGLDEKAVTEKWFDYDDHLLTAQQAIDEKLVDVIDDNDGKVPENIQNLSFKQVMNMYQGMTSSSGRDGFVSHLVNQMKTIFNISQKKTETTDIIMENIEKLRASLSLAETATVEDILNSINKLVADKKTADDQVTALKAEKDSAIVAKEKAEGDLTTSQSALAETTRLYDALKAKDATDESTAKKDKDKSDEWNDPSAVFAHNKLADQA